MTNALTVLIVDDQVGEILWLLELLDDRGYGALVATNEKDANERLAAIRDGAEEYAAAIFDVMVSTLSIEDIIGSQAELNDDFFRASKDTGLRLCRKAREYGLSLPIACLTVRQDPGVEAIQEELNIPVYHRIPLDKSDSILEFLDRHLPALPSSRAAERPPAVGKERRTSKRKR